MIINILISKEVIYYLVKRTLKIRESYFILFYINHKLIKVVRMLVNETGILVNTRVQELLYTYTIVL